MMMTMMMECYQRYNTLNTLCWCPISLSLCPMWCFINWCHFWWSILSNTNKCTLYQSWKSNTQRPKKDRARLNSWRFPWNGNYSGAICGTCDHATATKSKCISKVENFHWKTLVYSTLTIVIVDWPLRFLLNHMKQSTNQPVITTALYVSLPSRKMPYQLVNENCCSNFSIALHISLPDYCHTINPQRAEWMEYIRKNGGPN